MLSMIKMTKIVLSCFRFRTNFATNKYTKCLNSSLDVVISGGHVCHADWSGPHMVGVIN